MEAIYNSFENVIPNRRYPSMYFPFFSIAESSNIKAFTPISECDLLTSDIPCSNCISVRLTTANKNNLQLILKLLSNL